MLGVVALLTSVLVAACIRQHPHYERARPLLEAIAAGKERGVISAHSLAEAFSALTSVPEHTLSRSRAERSASRKPLPEQSGSGSLDRREEVTNGVRG